MAQKSKGMRRKTRKKLTGDSRRSGSIESRLQALDGGEQAVIDIDPSEQGGMPHPRFHGRIATVQERRGRSYVITVDDGGREKQFTVHPAHLRPV